MESNLDRPNTYWKVIDIFDVWIVTGHKPSNAYYGSANIQEPIYQNIIAEEGDEIHNLHGGIFIVKFGTSKGMPVRPSKPGEFAPFEKGRYYAKFPLDKLDEIPVFAANKNVKYRESVETFMTVPEDIRLPKTKIILEKGDKIKIVTERTMYMHFEFQDSEDFETFVDTYENIVVPGSLKYNFNRVSLYPRPGTTDQEEIEDDIDHVYGPSNVDVTYS